MWTGVDPKQDLPRVGSPAFLLFLSLPNDCDNDFAVKVLFSLSTNTGPKLSLNSVPLCFISDNLVKIILSFCQQLER